MRFIGRALLFALVMGMGADLPVQASTINFDDIDATAGDVILTSYQGYNWTNISVYTNTPGFPGYNNGIVSTPNAAYTAGDALGSPIISTIASSSPFNFISGYFGSGWYDGLTVTVEGLYDGTEGFAKTVVVNTTGVAFESFDFTRINEVEVFSTITSATSDPYGCGPSGCSQVTMDNLTLTPANSPEPSTMALGILGVLAFATFRRLKFSRTVSK